jgi:hypothetical protein
MCEEAKTPSAKSNLLLAIGGSVLKTTPLSQTRRPSYQAQSTSPSSPSTRSGIYLPAASRPYQRHYDNIDRSPAWDRLRDDAGEGRRWEAVAELCEESKGVHRQWDLDGCRDMRCYVIEDGRDYQLWESRRSIPARHVSWPLLSESTNQPSTSGHGTRGGPSPSAVSSKGSVEDSTRVYKASV